MTLQEVNLTLIGIPYATLLGAVGIKLVIENNPSHWKWAFYVLGAFSILYAIVVGVFTFSEFNFITGITLSFYILGGLLLLIFTYRFLDRKFIYQSCELNSIIKDFTSDADRNEIKLFGGDLNFLGNSVLEMNNNAQYIDLRASNFTKVSILCVEPANADTRTRYGKILHDLPVTEFRFYKPQHADLLIRGRLKKLQGVDKLLIYNKLGAGRYQLILTDTSNSNGALYNNIWNLIWSLATILDVDQKNELLASFMH